VAQEAQEAQKKFLGGLAALIGTSKKFKESSPVMLEAT
jgi:hypothetical protein